MDQVWGHMPFWTRNPHSSFFNTEELLSAVLLASHAAGEPAGVAAARIAHLGGCKRFDMAWMFVGKAEKAAAQAILGAAEGCAELSAAELEEAAKRYGVALA